MESGRERVDREAGVVGEVGVVGDAGVGGEVGVGWRAELIAGSNGKGMAGVKMESRSYFAYGSNMGEAQMRLRCSAAVPVCTATLSGYRFIINKRGVATVVPSTESQVHGLLWSLAEADERELDQYEGVGHGTYTKDELSVMTASGDRISALVYVAANPVEGVARPGYVEGILDAAARLSFPTEYQKELKQWLSTDESPS